MQFKNPSSRLFDASVTFAIALLVLTHVVVAQSSGPAKDQNFTPGIDLSMGLLGQTTFARNPTTFEVSPEWTGITQQSQSQSPSAGALITFHHAIKPYLAYNVNFSYTRFTQRDSEGSGYVPVGNPPGGYGAGSYDSGALDTHMYELTAAYVFQGPRAERFRTFGQIGGGALFFDPIGASFAHPQTNPAMVFGAGGEYDVTSHLSVRAEYRGLFYKMTDFGIYSGLPRHRFFTVTNMPGISLVYRLKPTPIAQTLGKRDNFSLGADVSLGLMGQMTFARTRTTTDVAGGVPNTQLNTSQSPSAGTLFAFHRAYKPYLGYNVNFGYTRFTQINSVGRPSAVPGTFASFSGVSLDTRMYEMSAAYAFLGPRSKKFRTIGQVGAGELVFQPMHSSVSAEVKSNAAIVFGMGGEYDVSPHVSIRAEYRGLFYRTPTGKDFPARRLYTVTNVPAISLVYHFGSSPSLKHREKSEENSK